MTTLTLIYTADSAGNFINPETGQPWNFSEDENFFHNIIAHKSIICGRKTFEKNWRKFIGAMSINILGTDYKNFAPMHYSLELQSNKHTQIAQALNIAAFAAMGCEQKEIFCVGGKQTIELFAPFASRILLTHVIDDYEINAKEIALGLLRDKETADRLKLWFPLHVAALIQYYGEDLSSIDDGIFTAWESEGEDYCEYGHFDPLILTENDIKLGFRHFALRRKVPIEF